MLKNTPSIDIIVGNSHVYAWEEPLRQMWWERGVRLLCKALRKRSTTLLVSLPAAIPFLYNFLDTKS